MPASKLSLPLACLTLALAPGVASAAAGDLDPTFGIGGTRVLPLALRRGFSLGDFSTAWAAALAPDGKVVVGRA